MDGDPTQAGIDRMKVADSLVMPAALWAGVSEGAIHCKSVQEERISAETI